jgi:hypothetical protein
MLGKRILVRWQVVVLTAVLIGLLSLQGVARTRAWSGWSEVPPQNGITYLALAATSFEGQLYLFAVDTNRGIQVNKYDGSYWTGWSLVPGGGTTNVALAATAVSNTKLYLFAKDDNDHIVMNIKPYQSSWTGWQEVPPGTGLTTLALAATTSLDGTLLLFAVGTNQHIFINQLGVGTWTGWQEVPGNKTTDAPVAASGSGGTHDVYVFAKGMGTDTHIYMNHYSTQTDLWDGWNTSPGGLTKVGLAAAWDGSLQGGTQVYLFAVDLNRQPVFNTYVGTNWTGWAPLGGTTYVPLAGTYFLDRFYLFAKGDNNHIFMNVRN